MVKAHAYWDTNICTPNNVATSENFKDKWSVIPPDECASGNPALLRFGLKRTIQILLLINSFGKKELSNCVLALNSTLPFLFTKSNNSVWCFLISNLKD